METATSTRSPPFPPFTRDSAMQKVHLAEDAWNTRDPAKVALAYAIDSRWRIRSEFIEKHLSTNSRASLNVRSRTLTTARRGYSRPAIRSSSFICFFLLRFLNILLHRRLGEHRRWSQNGHNKSAILTN